MVVNVLKEIFRANLIKSKVYIKDTILLVVYDFLTFVIQVMFFKIIYSHVLIIEGWEFKDILFLLATSQIIEILYYTLFFGGFASVSDWVLTGRFDHFLVLPKYRRLFMILYEIDVKKIISLLFPIFLLYKFAPFTSVLEIGIYILFISIGLFTRFSFGYFVSSLVLIFTRISAIQSVEMELFSYSNFPYVIYHGLWKWVFLFIIPVGVIANGPVSFFKENTYFVLLISFFAGVSFFLLANLSYKLFLKRYQSAGG